MTGEEWVEAVLLGVGAAALVVLAALLGMMVGILAGMGA